MVRVNAPITGDPLPEDQRPFLGGSADQIAVDLARIAPLRIDHVFFSTGSAPSLDEEVRRLERLQDAAQRRAT